MTRSFSALPFLFLCAVTTAGMMVPAHAADVVPPAEVANLQVARNGADLVLTWNAVTGNAVGGSETTTSYRIYRGTTPGFVPDRVGSSNLLGTSSTTTFTHVGGANAAGNFFYAGTVSFPIHAKVTFQGRERIMTAAQSSGNCNNCHTQNGANGAPGRIILP